MNLNFRILCYIKIKGYIKQQRTSRIIYRKLSWKRFIGEVSSRVQVAVSKYYDLPVVVIRTIIEYFTTVTRNTSKFHFKFSVTYVITMTSKLD